MPTHVPKLRALPHHPRKYALPLPALAWDTHVHVLDPVRFPYAAAPAYTPPRAVATAVRSALDRLAIPNVVLVQPSVYGHDNGALLDALGWAGFKGRKARGVVAFDPADAQVTDATLRQWHAQGVRGVRLNLKSTGARLERGALAHRLQQYQDRVGALGWAVSLHAELAAMRDVLPAASGLHVPLVFEHFGCPPAPPPATAAGLDALPGWRELLQLAESGRAVVKLSAPFRFSARGDYGDLEAVVKTLLAANDGHAVMWASDFPHTRFEDKVRHEHRERWLKRCLEWCDGDQVLAARLFRGNAWRVFEGGAEGKEERESRKAEKEKKLEKKNRARERNLEREQAKAAQRGEVLEVTEKTWKKKGERYAAVKTGATATEVKVAEPKNRSQQEEAPQKKAPKAGDSWNPLKQAASWWKSGGGKA